MEFAIHTRHPLLPHPSIGPVVPTFAISSSVICIPCSPCRLNLSHEHEHYPKRSQVVQENTLKSSPNTICETHAQNMLDNHLQNADTGSSQNGRVPPRWEFQWGFGGSKFRDNPKSSPKFLAHVKTWQCIRVNVDNESIHHLYVP